MESKEIYKQLTEIFHDLFDDDAIVLTPETKAGDIPGWNSLMHVNVILAAEARFNVKFKASEVEALHSVGNLVDLIEIKVDQVRKVRV